MVMAESWALRDNLRVCHFGVGTSTGLQRVQCLSIRQRSVFRTGDKLVGVLGDNEEWRQKEEREDLLAGSKRLPDRSVSKINLLLADKQAPNDSMLRTLPPYKVLPIHIYIYIYIYI